MADHQLLDQGSIFVKTSDNSNSDVITTVKEQHRSCTPDAVIETSYKQQLFLAEDNRADHDDDYIHTSISVALYPFIHIPHKLTTQSFNSCSEIDTLLGLGWGEGHLPSLYLSLCSFDMDVRTLSLPHTTPLVSCSSQSATIERIGGTPVKQWHT